MQSNEQSLSNLISILQSLTPTELRRSYETLVKKYPREDGSQPAKSEVYAVYQKLLQNQQTPFNKNLEKYLQKKPVRSLSGVTPVTVLTKPFPCPGECIFCPTDVRMPKSYIASEPGAQRAAQNAFDPYAQAISRLQTYKEIGHDIGKIELIVLGGTWSVYPEPYQIWFITRLFKALNDFGRNTVEHIDVSQIDLNEKKSTEDSYNNYIKKTKYIYTSENAAWADLEREQYDNIGSQCRCVGLVLETRPDYVTEHESLRLRRLGTTKVQIGIQSVNDTVLQQNKRGHSVGQTIEALKLLRLAGFKIHAHWMPNLYGNSVHSDIEEYKQLFENPAFRPDELKIYPCSLIADTELMHVFNSGKWHPYSQEELADIISYCLTHTPEYCRLTRIVRDIPSQEIVEGNKKTNFRQIIESSLSKSQLSDIRSREIKAESFDMDAISLDDVIYETLVSTEHFLQFITPDRKIAAFLRLSLPKSPTFMTELNGAAVIREIHVYGKAIAPGLNEAAAAQHQGFGTRLIKQAEQIAHKYGYKKLAVISAIGTKDYYRKKGFTDGYLYQYKLVAD